jgi:Domain of unknown function (DUF4156)
MTTARSGTSRGRNQKGICRVKQFITAVAVLLMCQGCANTPSRQAAAVKEMDARAVASCALISTIHGKSLLGGAASNSAVNAIVDVKEQAAGLGANVVVLQSVDSGNMYTPATATAKAYKCN